MDFQVEADILRALGRVIANHHLHKGEKPVHWCAECRSALAEAEVESEAEDQEDGEESGEQSSQQNQRQNEGKKQGRRQQQPQRHVGGSAGYRVGQRRASVGQRIRGPAGDLLRHMGEQTERERIRAAH